MMSIGGGGGGGGGFTTSQWAELEHQALIFKYITAGVPVPPDLLLPIRSSFDAIQSPFYRHSSLGYYSYYGKKLDPEPWRCRRTDGKKWRCAKEAYPDSKYCERHMHRGRNRSRKPVESHSSLSVTKTQTPISSSTPLLTSAPALNTNGRFQVQPLSSSPALTNPSGLCLRGPTTSPYLNNRYCLNNAVKAESGERHLYSEPSGSSFAYASNYSLMGSSSYPSLYLNDPLRHEEDLGQVVTISSLSKDQQKHSFNGFGFGLDEPVKTENQLLRPFFDEWPKNKGDSWPDLEDHRANTNSSSFSTTRLSISIPNDD